MSQENVEVVRRCHAEWRGKASGAEGETPVLPAFWLRARKVLRAGSSAKLSEALRDGIRVR
jgi:hypothetical protein